MEQLFSFYALIFGLLVGSFLNVVILRMPAKKDIVKTRSACTQCGSQLRWYHNIPVISYLFLRGKCGFCGKKISIRYPLIEILTGLVSFWLFPEDINTLTMAHYIFYFTIACIFICHFFIDLDHHLLLDSLNLYLLALILTFVIFNFDWRYWLVGGVIGFGVPLGVTWLFYKLRGQIGLGGGDIKLFGIIGLFVGPTGIIFNIFLSCMLGALIGLLFIALKRMTKDKPMAFGPAIILVAVLQIYFPQYASILQSWFF